MTAPAETAVAALPLLREAGRIAAAVRKLGASRIVPGASLRDVCEELEEEIQRRGAGVAFPVQTSRNEIAAHYCPAPDEETRYAEGDLAKLDIGVHVDGWVVDTAVTVNVGDRPEGRRLVDAAEAALAAAIRAAGPGVSVGRIAHAIAGEIRTRGLRPVRNLCGHGVGRWRVHGPPPIPNVPDGTHGRLKPGRVVAIEPFASDGAGLVVERGTAEVFMLRPPRHDAPGVDAEVVEAIRAFRGLPFSRRQLARFGSGRVRSALAELSRRGGLVSYPPLVEPAGHPVAQAEHSLFIAADGVEVLT